MFTDVLVLLLLLFPAGLWQMPPTTFRVMDVPGETAAHLVGTFTIRNVCVSFHNTSGAAFRSLFVAMDSDYSAMVHGFSEFAWGFRRVTTVRPVQDEAERAMLAAQCVRRRLGLALYFSTTNLAHQIHHAAGAWQALHAHANGTEETTFIPIVSNVAGLWVRPGHWRNYAWEFTVRGLTAAGGAAIASQLGDLLSAPCTCFDRVEGGLGGHNPHSMAATSRNVQHRWSEAVLQSSTMAVLRDATGQARALDVPTSTLLYVSRRTGSRFVTNEAAVLQTLHARFPNQIRPVVLEWLPLVTQVRLIASSAGFIGVHGQAFVLAVFLPSLTRNTAVVEILPTLNKHYWQHANLYPDISTAHGTRHFSTSAELVNASSCKPQLARRLGGSPLRCNITIADMASFVRIVSLAISWCQVSSKREVLDDARWAALRWYGPTWGLNDGTANLAFPLDAKSSWARGTQRRIPRHESCARQASTRPSLYDRSLECLNATERLLLERRLITAAEDATHPLIVRSANLARKERGRASGTGVGRRQSHSRLRG